MVSLIIVNQIGYEKYGFFTVALAYIGIINIIFNFQSFSAVIKFGHIALARNDRNLLKMHIKQALVQDFSAALLAFFLSYFVLNSVSDFFHWNHQIIAMISILSFSILFNITGSAIGVLRLFEKFNYISILAVLDAFIKLSLVLFGVYIKQDYIYYVKIELTSIVISSLLSWFVALLVLKENDLLDFWKVKIGFNNDFFKFNLYNNIVTTLDLPVGEITKIIINQMLGPVELGFYNILAKIGNVIFKVTGPITVVVFPELSKRIAKGEIKKAFRLTENIVIFSTVVGLVITFFQFLTFTIWSPIIFKNVLVNRYTVLAYFIYIVVCASISTIHQLFVALGLVKYNVIIVLIVNSLYLVLVFYTMSKNHFGLIGLILSMFLQAITVVIIKILIIRRKITISD